MSSTGSDGLARLRAAMEEAALLVPHDLDATRVRATIAITSVADGTGWWPTIDGRASVYNSSLVAEDADRAPGPMLWFVADSVQDTLAERGGDGARRWPLCPEHGLVLHPSVEDDDVAVWGCNAVESWHVVSRIGELPPT